MLFVLIFSSLLFARATLLSDEHVMRALLNNGRRAAHARSLQPPGPPPPGGGGGGGPPGGGLAPGATSDTTCTSSTCTTTGGGNFHNLSLTYSSSTGVFSGALVTNTCPNHASAYKYHNVQDLNVGAASASCQKFTLPVTAYTAGTLTATPLRDAIGYTISGGELIYGPMDAGFSLGQVCTNGIGTCPAGTDTRMCGALQEKICGTANLKGNTTASMHMLLSDCGGHAGYHNHEGLACEYSATATGHSTLIGVLLDGRGLYGQYESTGTPPANLDACNGHYGATPSTVVTTTTGTTTYPPSTNVYHYHVTTEAPFVAGCFGPSISLAAANALYDSCTKTTVCTCDQSKTCSCNAGQYMSSICTSLGSYSSYILDCPIYKDASAGTSQSQVNTADSSCIPCAGNCMDTTSSASSSTSTTATTTLSSTDKAIIGGVVGGGGGLLLIGVLYYVFFKKQAAQAALVAAPPLSSIHARKAGVV